MARKYKKSSNRGKVGVKSNTTDPLSLGMIDVKGQLHYLSPHILIPYKNQARENRDEEGLSELATSIQSQGIIQPLQIIPSLGQASQFEVVCGERRLQAAKKIGLDKIPCMILDRPIDANEIALIENIQREDLHPIELANAVERLLQEDKYSNQTILAGKIGMSKSKMSHLLAIARLPEDVKKHLVKKKDIKINFLKKLAYMKDEKIVREKVFQVSCTAEKYKSILRISFDGCSFRFDHLKTTHLSSSEKVLLKEELTRLIEWLTV
jgi:ParB family chromosome partitioning protein